MKSPLIGCPLEGNRLGRFVPCDTRSNGEVVKQQVLEQQTCANSIIRETVCGICPQLFESAVNWNGKDHAGLESLAMAPEAEQGDRMFLGVSGTIKTETEGKRFFPMTEAAHNEARDFLE
jgi:hypothetical protein